MDAVASGPGNLRTVSANHRFAAAPGAFASLHPDIPPAIADRVEERVEEECSPTKRGPIPEGTGPG